MLYLLSNLSFIRLLFLIAGIRVYNLCGAGGSSLIFVFPFSYQSKYCSLMKLFLFLCLLLGAAYAGTINSESFQPIIEKVNSLKTTWKAGNNFASHTTVSSIKRLLGSLKSDRKFPLREKHVIPNAMIPEEFDARKQWPQCPTISQISDQSNCGSCWAVAAANALSDRFCIASNGTFTTPLSVEELLTCCDECGYGCNGGFPEAAWDYFHENGIVTGGAYGSGVGCQPYGMEPCEHHTSGSLSPCASLPEYDTPDCEKRCTNPSYTIPFKQDHHRAKSGYSLENVEEIQKDIMTHGPVEASFSVYSDFPTYRSGVYKYTDGELLGGHAVRVIGWGRENGTPYWLIANSWNTHWGDGGVFKIIRGRDECGIESGVVAGLPIL